MENNSANTVVLCTCKTSPHAPNTDHNLQDLPLGESMNHCPSVCCESFTKLFHRNKQTRLQTKLQTYKQTNKHSRPKPLYLLLPRYTIIVIIIIIILILIVGLVSTL